MKEELIQVGDRDVDRGVPLVGEPRGPPELDPAHDERRNERSILRVARLDDFQVDLAGGVFLEETGQGQAPGVVGSKRQTDDGLKKGEAGARLGSGDRDKSLVIGDE